MSRSCRIVRMTRVLTVWLVAALVCPAFGEIAGSTSRMPCSSAHACCRRPPAASGCPHERSAATHEAKCHGTICILTCDSRQDSAVAPAVVIGFYPASITSNPTVVVTRVAARANDGVRSFIPLPLTPPPRILAAA